ncbi:MAG: hypothetical protein JWM53_2269, partial [bacterium]|nr:hypothetical protein [bacterium]
MRRDLARNSQTARLAVTAAALALAGLTLAAWARWSASTAVDGTRAEAAVAAERLGGVLSTAIATARWRAEGLAAMPAVRAAIERDLATVRDLARAEGFVLTPAAHETVEIFQVARHKRPLSLMRAPERSPTLGIARANEVRIDEEAGALVVTVAVPARPLAAHAEVQGAVAVATRVDLSSLAPAGLTAEVDGAGEPVALSAQHPPDGARLVTVPVPLGDVGARGTP